MRATTGRLRFLTLTVLIALGCTAGASQLSSVSPTASTVPADSLLRVGQYAELDARMSEIQLAYERGALSEAELRDAQTAAHALGIRLLALNARTPGEIETAFETLLREGAGGLVVSGWPTPRREASRSSG